MSIRRRLYALLGIALPLALALASCGPNPGKADAYEQLADSMMASSAYVGAIATMEKSLKYDPNEPRRWVKLGRAQRSAGLPAQAAVSFQRALDLEPANIEGLQNMSILMVRAGRFDEAKGYIEPLMALQPDDVAGLLSLGAIAMFRQQYSEANKYADRLIQVAPSSMGGYSLKARVLKAQGRGREATDLLDKQVEVNPADTELALQLMDLYRETNDVQGVRKAALMLTKLVPEDPRYAMEAARAYHAQGDEQASRAIVDSLAQRYRGNPDMIRAIADFWLGSMPRDRALAKIIELGNRLAGNPKAELAELLTDQGMAQASVNLLKADAAGDVNSANADLHAVYARALFRTGKPKDAKAEAQKVLDFDPSNTVALVIRARVELEAGDVNSALTDAQLAVTNDRDSEDAAVLLPQIHSAMGSKVLAERTWGDAQIRLPRSDAVASGRAAWLVKQGRADDAREVSGTFARANLGNINAWRRYHDLCVQTKEECAKRAAEHVAVLER